MSKRFGFLTTDPNYWLNATNLTQALTASGHKLAGIFRVSPPGRTISKIHCHCTATAGTVPTFEIELQGVTLGNPPVPNGTLVATGAEGNLTPSVGANTVTLGTPYAASARQHIAIVLQYVSGTINGSNNATFRSCLGVRNNDSVLSPLALVNTASWVWQTGGAHGFMIEYSDGTFQPWGCLFDRSLYGIGSADTPDEIGNKFVPAIDLKIRGFWSMYRSISTTSDSAFKLYDGADTVLENITLEGDEMGTPAQQQPVYLPLSAIRTLNAGTTYRLTCLPLQTTQVRVDEMNFLTSNSRRVALGMGDSDGIYSTYEKTSRTDAGSWTDDSTRAMSLWLEHNLIGEESSGGSGGGARSLQIGSGSLMV